MSTHPRTELKGALAVCKGSFLCVGFFSFFVNLLMLVPSFYMLQVYDRAVGSASQSTLLMLTLIMLLLMITMGGLEWVRSRIMVRISTRLDTLLGQRLFDASFKRALNTNGMNASAQPLSDLNALRQFLTGNGLFAFFDAPWIPIYLAVMFIFHPWYGWMGVGSAVLLGALAFVNEKLTHAPLQAANREQMAATTFTNKSLRNAEVVESMGMLASLRQHWNGQTHKVLTLQSLASDRAATMMAMSRTFRQIVQSLMLGLGAYLTINHEISPGLMIAGSILLGRALAPIDQLIGVWKGFLGARSQYARLHELLVNIAAEPERMSLPAPEGAIRVEGLSVGSPGNRKPIIRGVDFQVAVGEVVGIIGPSGAGKSTLARALLGIWPSLAGTVRLDGADISQWRRDELGQYIGYLPQDIELFEGSISQNISRFGPVNAPAVVAAARMAGVHELVLQLPDGYDTLIGANGGGLSGGQRQRIGLARALYGEPRLVVLDEPNSNLDDAGEKMLGQALQKLRQSRATVFVITHRSGVLAQVDKLLVLNHGELSLFGPRDKVLARLQGATPTVHQAAAIES
ncbi:type I secretion system permease/ATPase [Pseudomonas fluorescens]|uniref:Type I secretion system permease/ATPase n=1 Tax=Pseudomonas fluorescens TaxID=294 RepID=A0A944DMF0_PSEFL|nr:type I secretion system permease/ATPase [Pseudomonas fluorescens]MBT2295938.1 type I secretion system permease/ATPase [Pseudomonas fluorescens]MBT2306195.1 type I secretion system permease/ATPase [Pseudomonas fluorescens]MBT2314448.1 type I secretion system permease/ATPase [Pseudomonas fluorescens]MBT2315803.1 type I secretion system permease/ATPase [Pseudomonas fluorescens]MBT2330408.1 type I secretion system permease/ATPase [Pseudomonas fluorescens]